jgi:glycosyltransferase involved in cell wall biosynthesis
MDPLKGFDTLIEALRLLRERGLDAKLRVAGPADRMHPGYGDTLRALVERLGLADHVEVAWVDDLDGLYESCRVVAQGSRPPKPGRPSEGAPTTLMEAMSHSRPVVAPDEAGIAEVVGDGGTLVGERTPEAFADALEPFLRDPSLADEVGQLGRRRAAARFTLERTVETLTGLYRELAAEKR